MENLEDLKLTGTEENNTDDTLSTETVNNTEDTKDVENVEATENKEDETKEETKEDKDIDVTASGDEKSNPINISTLDDQSLNTSVKAEETNFEELYSDAKKQLEAMTQEVEGLKKSKVDLEEENKKLKSDIASLRENPFYNSTKTTNDRKITDLNEFSVEDVKKMRNRI